jgi:hypothetical protein
VAQDIPLTVVYEDADLIVVDKPAGMVVHPAAGNPDGTLVNALLHHCRGQLSGIGGVARPGIVHRIDKDTSGLLVVAKTDVAHEGLARQFADHSIVRAYRAVTGGAPTPPAGTIRARSRDPRTTARRWPCGRGAGQARGHALSHARTAGCPRWSNAGSKPGGPIRCAFTLHQSVIRYWVTLSMDDARRGCGRSCPGSNSGDRLSTRPSWGSFIPSAVNACISSVRRPSIWNS